MVYILLGQGFEEIEALAPCDILRRGGVEVALVGVEGKSVSGGHGIAVTADCTVAEIDFDVAEMIVVPGGLGGVTCIENTSAAMSAVKKIYDRGREVAAICAGPRVLAALGMLDGREAVCYPGMEPEMAGGKMLSGVSTARDGRVTTGRGPGSAIDFGLRLLAVLRGQNAAEQVRAAMHYDR